MKKENKKNKVGIVCCFKCYDDDAKLLWLVDEIYCEYCIKKLKEKNEI